MIKLDFFHKIKSYLPVLIHCINGDNNSDFVLKFEYVEQGEEKTEKIMNAKDVSKLDKIVLDKDQKLICVFSGKLPDINTLKALKTSIEKNNLQKKPCSLNFKGFTGSAEDLNYLQKQISWDEMHLTFHSDKTYEILNLMQEALKVTGKKLYITNAPFWTNIIYSKLQQIFKGSFVEHTADDGNKRSINIIKGDINKGEKIVLFNIIWEKKRLKMPEFPQMENPMKQTGNKREEKREENSRDRNIKVRIEDIKKSSDVSDNVKNGLSDAVKESKKEDGGGRQNAAAYGRILEHIVRYPFAGNCRLKEVFDPLTKKMVSPNDRTAYINSVVRAVGEELVGMDKIIKLIANQIYDKTEKQPNHLKKRNIQSALLYGAPGTAKSSLCRSIAHHTGCPVIFINVAGVHRGAENLKGLGPSYVASHPGSIWTGIENEAGFKLEAETVNQLKASGDRLFIVVIDEIDKSDSSTQQALIQIIDPVNPKCSDDFTGVDLDLEKAIFLFTANDIKNINPILLDRLQTYETKNYTLQEKERICEVILEQEKKEKQIDIANVVIKKEICKELVDKYDRGSLGMRTLQKIISRLCAEVSYAIKEDSNQKIEIGRHNLSSYIGEPKVSDDLISNVMSTGVFQGTINTVKENHTQNGIESISNFENKTVVAVKSSSHDRNGNNCISDQSDINNVRVAYDIASHVYNNSPLLLQYRGDHNGNTSFKMQVFGKMNNGAIKGKEIEDLALLMLISMESLRLNTPVNKNIFLLGSLNVNGELATSENLVKKGLHLLDSLNASSFEKVELLIVGPDSHKKSLEEYFGTRTNITMVKNIREILEKLFPQKLAKPLIENKK